MDSLGRLRSLPLAAYLEVCVELTCVVFTAICSDPGDSQALGRFLEDERTLNRQKERISIIRHTVLSLARYGCTESLVIKELELISKKLFLALKEEKRILKDWPFQFPVAFIKYFKGIKSSIRS